MAFHLEINGELLRDRWKWESEAITKTPDGFEKLVIVLSHELAPIQASVNTLLDGSSFMVRWLEIKNQSDKPTAISRIFPWSGILFAEEQGFSLTTQEEAQRFYLGRYKNHHVLMEGEFFWQEITLGVCANARHACAEEIHSPEKQ